MSSVRFIVLTVALIALARALFGWLGVTGWWVLPFAVMLVAAFVYWLDGAFRAKGKSKRSE